MDDKKKKIQEILEKYGYDIDGGIGRKLYGRATATSAGTKYFLNNYRSSLKKINPGDDYLPYLDALEAFADQISQRNRAYRAISDPNAKDALRRSDLIFDVPIEIADNTMPGRSAVLERIENLPEQIRDEEIEKYFASTSQTKEITMPRGRGSIYKFTEEPEQTAPQKGGGGGGGGQKQAAPTKQEIPNPYIDLPTEELEWRLKNATSKEEAQQIVDALRAQRAQKEDERVPEVKQRRDLLGHLSDAGRAILGYAGALKDVPHYKMSRPFDDYVRRSQRMSEMGFSQEEKQAFNDAASNAYAYDVKSIKGLAGGSAGTALANLGRAADRLYDSKVEFAARDKAVKNQNLRMFGQAAQSYENVNRQIFQDGLTQAMMNKEAGAALARDAVTNMLNRNQYEKMYGPGSHFDRYQKLLIQRTQAQLDTQKLAQENLIRSMEDQYLGMYEDEDQVDNSFGTVQGTQDLQNFGNATPDDPTGRKATLDQTYASMTKDPETGAIQYKDASTGEDVIILPSEQGGATITRTNPETGITEKNTRLNTGMSGGTTRTGQVSADDFEAQNRMREQFGLEPYSRYDYIQMRRKEGFFDGGITKGAYNHKTNPLAVIDKKGNHTGMELTGGEGVFDKPAMKKIEAFAKKKDYEKLGMFVAKEMQTWDK